MSLNQKRRKVGRDAPETRPIADPGDEPSRGAQEFSIVGIGASAGGLEACSALLKQLPPDTGLAFVVVQRYGARQKHASRGRSPGRVFD